MSELITYKVVEGVAQLSLDRPAARNALSLSMYSSLIGYLRRADADPQVHSLLLDGGSYFTAGNDLDDFIGYRKRGEFIALTFLKTLHHFSKPIVAAVEGGAVGVGATMLQHCDFVYAGASTRFSLPFINFGLCVEGGSSQLLGQGASAKQAARWLMLGEPFSATDALRAGLLTEVVDDGMARDKALKTLNRLTQLHLEGLQATKVLIRRARQGLEETLEVEIDQFTSLLESDYVQQCLHRFSKRSRT